MAGSVNKVTLIGNLGKDPESRTMQNGGKVVSFSLATSESWKDKTSGERQECTQWHNIVIFNEQLAGVAERYLKKAPRFTSKASLKPANGRTRTKRTDGRRKSCCAPTRAS